MRQQARFGFLKRLIFFAIIVLVGVFLYRLYQNQEDVSNALSRLSKAFEVVKASIPKPSVLPVVEPVDRTTWVDIQKQTKDAVVQVLVTKAPFNWIEPYSPPDQGMGTGSGFFINGDGHIITNFHVVSDETSIKVQVPSLGQEQFSAEVIGVDPERDVALLRLTDDSLQKVLDKLGHISFLRLGNSDVLLRGQEVLALGYPLSTHTLKSTQGIISGRERLSGHPYSYIQMTAPLNPGNSGGPLLNAAGEAVGINAAGILLAQNVGYIIPINDVKSALEDLYKVKLLRKPYLGGIFMPSNPDTVAYLGNPSGGGYFVVKVIKGSLLEKAGVKENDMIYEINGLAVDRFGEVEVPWSEDRVSVLEVLNRLKVGDEIHLVMYRNGKKMDVKFPLELAAIPSVRQIYPEYEPDKIDYEFIGGMVFMELTANHVALFVERAPHLLRYRKQERQYKPALIVTNVLHNSAAYESRVISPGILVTEVNDTPVNTLAEFREAVKKAKGKKYLTFRTIDRAVEGMLVSLSIEKILKSEEELAAYFLQRGALYPRSKLIDYLKDNRGA